MKAKTPHSSKTPRKRAKSKSTWKQVLENMGVGNLLTMDDGRLEDLGKELIQWCHKEIEDPKSRRLSIERFFIDKGVPMNTAYNWLKRNAFFKSCYEQAKYMIGIKLRDGMLLREYSEKGVLIQLHHYLPEWKGIEAYQDERARIVRQDIESKQDITVVMEGFPSSQKVPEKKE